MASLGCRIRFGSLDFLATGHEDSAAELDSNLDTEQSPLGQTRTERAEPVQRVGGAAARIPPIGGWVVEKRIASRLQISRCTVHNHIGAIYQAFGVHSRAELLVCASSKATT